MGMRLFYVTVLVIFFPARDLWFCLRFSRGFWKRLIFPDGFCGEFVVDAWFFVVGWMVVFQR
ncbi:MAG: hypothetical protein WDN23_17745 [Edaphobacter sp.]